MSTNPPKTISFQVSGQTVTNNTPNENVSVGDHVRFRANQVVWVTFTSGEWPFTEAAPTNNEFSVSSGDGPYGAGPYTVSSSAVRVNNYNVSLTQNGAAKTTGTVELPPERF